MGKKWDYDVPSQEIWEECLRVLKPGGYLLAFAGTRTQHRMACRIEDAGFEIRDMIAWVYGSGFPKSLNVGKAIDALQGNERTVVDTRDVGHDITNGAYKDAKPERKIMDITVGNSEFEGWGTALKPSIEPITVARKPLSEKTVAANVLKHGTGGINIDGCRVEGEDTTTRHNSSSYMTGKIGEVQPIQEEYLTGSTLGRWPANFIHDGSDEVLALFPDTKSGGANGNRTKGPYSNDRTWKISNTKGAEVKGGLQASEGSAARFFYCAKASKKDRDSGLASFEEHKTLYSDGTGLKNNGDGSPRNILPTNKNNHPTVKPTDLMKYLCRLVTPPSGIVLDPFMGSGSTGKAAKLEGFKFIGIEKDEHYFITALNRIYSL